MRDAPNGLLESPNQRQKSRLSQLTGEVNPPAVEVERAAAPLGTASLARAAGLVSGLTFLSRLLGLVREQVFAALLGAGVYADAFQAAFRVPNLLRDLFAEGALSAAFVPTYAKAMAQGGRDRAFRLASRLLTVLAAILGLLVVAGYVFAGPLVRVLAPGFEGVAGKHELTVTLTRVMLPFLPLVSFAAVAMGMLNAHRRFGTPAVAPAVFNLVAIVWAAALWWWGFGAAQVAMGWAVGTVVGGAAQFLIQVPALWREGWRPRPEWAPGDPDLGAVARLMAPATVGLAAVQVNIFVNTLFASYENGAVSWLQYAFRILYLPIGIFGVAVGTVVTTGLAHRAAAGDLNGMRQAVERALRLLAFLTIPATAGLVALATPIVRLLFERGRFTPHDTSQTAIALVLFSVGLVAYTSVKVLAPAFYALGRPRIPLLASAAAVATNLAFVLALYRSLGFRAIALGTALGSLVNAAILLGAFSRRVGSLRRDGLPSSVIRVTIASAAMGVSAFWSARCLAGLVGVQGLTSQLVTALGPVTLGLVAYLALAWALRVTEMRDLLGAVRRRLAR
jgi:putative peptidoglycan lipid II flippase